MAPSLPPLSPGGPLPAPRLALAEEEPLALLSPEAGRAAWTNILSPQITGVEVPSPGTRTFHRMLVVASHFTGGLPAGATPVPRGPRHCGQFVSAEFDWPRQ